MVKRFVLTPRNIFLVDALGAFLSFSFLLVILLKFNGYIGMPNFLLTLLLIIALLLGLFSASCFLLVSRLWRSLLLTVIGLNVCYCLVTLVLVIFHLKDLKPLGVIYFFGEIIVISTLVMVEWSVWRDAWSIK
ncbi:hypothetical protein [Pseudochryseolinea flava]|uniref:Uncharacterized protein n=1 Tax=Pseudochryseolinea flava TaxID=2059302 RepID=A0A364Y2G8_9BACT|nr:hypothetical protein [Pseudochryseolinea flava]RAW00502.1 hypothetical protein DQQ10_12945 [Pseudochryseolinea flava]